MFKFVGDPLNKHEGPDVIRMYGMRFEKNGEPVEVEDAKIAAKLKGNRHFVSVDGRTKEAKVKKNGDKG